MMSLNPQIDDERVVSESDGMSSQEYKVRMSKIEISELVEMERLQAKIDWWDKMEPHFYRALGLLTVIMVVLMVFDLSK